MKKSERLNDMMIYLNQKDYFNLKDLMKKYNISKSTALRDIQSLEAIGMPIYTEYGRNGRYGLLKNRLFAPILFSLDELYGLYFSMLTLQAYESTPFHLSANHLKEKFERCLPKKHLKALNEMSNILHFDTIKHNNTSPYLQVIMLSALDEQVCKVQYKKKEEVKTYYLQFDEVTTRFGQWYVVGYNFERLHHQVLRCDKIIGIKHSSRFKPIPLEQLIAEKNSEFYKDTPTFFCVEIAPQAKDLFYKENYPNMSLKEEKNIMYIQGHYQAFELNFITNYLLNYDHLILSVEPYELKESLILRTEKRLAHLKEL